MAVATGNRTQTILVKMLCGMFDVERNGFVLNVNVT